MPAPPPPPPPPPPPATGGPPPPPPPPDSLPSRPGKAEVKDRSALLQDITKGTKLRKTVTNDRSAPMIEKKSSGPAIGGAPPVPGMPKPPGGLAPPVPGGNRLRSNSEGRSGGDDSSSSVPSAPQLGGLFAGGMPKLRSRGGVDTGANRDAAYLSDSEASRPDPPAASAPKPPTARPPPVPSSTESPSAPPVNPLVANLRKPPPKPASRPSSTVSTTSTKTAPEVPPRAPPPVPGTKAPPPPPVRKPSAPAPPPPPSSASPAPPSAPPPPPSSSAPKPPASGPPPPPAPPASAPQPPNGAQAAAASIAVQAARNAFGNSHAPSAPPPPPPTSSAPSAPAAPPPPPPTSAPSPPSAPPAPPAAPPPRPATSSRPGSHDDHQAKSGRSTLDPSAYTLINGGSSPSASPRTSGIIRIEDNRFKFQDESLFPKPRPFSGGVRMYRAGRGSSVPLDLNSLG
ncbi:hypothetical protein VTN96DRAFT_9790 [Rasamsonia emersonii]